jgi:hypothetical protein
MSDDKSHKTAINSRPVKQYWSYAAISTKHVLKQLKYVWEYRA